MNFIISNCKTCGDEIEGQNIRRICDGCADEKTRERNKKSYEKVKVLVKKKKCKYCNEEFIWKFQSHPTQIFCSRKCANEDSKKKFEKFKKGIITRGDGLIYNYYKLRFEIFKRDNFTCKYCGRNPQFDKITLHCDHIIPKKGGGKFIFENLITSCLECNEGKKDVLLSERMVNKKGRYCYDKKGERRNSKGETHQIKVSDFEEGE